MDLATERIEVNTTTRITEVSLLAEHRSQYQETDDSKVAPEELRFRLYRKLNCEDDQPAFDMTSFYDLISFINGRETPVCFISHNEGVFDYPILKLQEQLKEFNVSLPDNIRWADSLTGFRYILENKNWKPNVNSSTFNLNSSNKQEDDLEATNSYKLKDIYDHVRNTDINTHPHENYITMMFKISQVFGRFFVTWADQNQRCLNEEKVKDVMIKDQKKTGKDRGGNSKLGFRTKIQPSSASLC